MIWRRRALAGTMLSIEPTARARSMVWIASNSAALVVRDGFDMLDEDLEEERFFMTTRTAFWVAPEGSRARAVSDELIRVLEF